MAAEAACDDDDPTTKTDICDGEGGCAGTTYACEPLQCHASSTPNGTDCAITFKAAGIPCDDGDPATKDDACAEGACAGQAYDCQPTQCQATATPDGAGCITSDKASGAPCDDGDPATKTDVCDGSGGCAGTPYACTPGQCDASSTPDGQGCVPLFAASGLSCDDGDLSTKDDACNGAGGCAGTAYSCEPGQCEATSTPDGDGCQVTFKGDGAPCDDGLTNTKLDVCDGAGGCAGSPYTCTPSQCDAAAVPDGVGCAPEYKAAGLTCDDGDSSTKDDACDGAGGCSGTPYTCEPTQCETGSTADGQGCVVTYHGAGAPCDDGDVGTKTDICDGAGACAGTEYTCEPGACEATSQPNGTDCSVTYMAADVGCDDLDDATKDDVCDGSGTCAGTPFVCQAGPCEATSVPNGADCTVVLIPDDTSCDDGDLCNGLETCQSGACTSGESVTCAPSDVVCETVACIPASGECVTTTDANCCGNSAIEAPETCDDGNAATEACAYGETECTVCDADCQETAGATSYCGDDNLNNANGEACDNGSDNCSGDSCTGGDAVVVFSYTGGAQTWTVPAAVSTVTVATWAAAGGGSNAEGKQFPGGGGGYARGTFAVSTGDQLTILVGQGGQLSSSGKISAYPNGGKPGLRGGYTMGGGGGRSAVTRAGVEMVVAGAGGGAGGTGWSSGTPTSGGGGGGPSGGDGSAANPGGNNAACAGKGATQSGGGSGGSCNSGGWGGPAGGAGSKNKGGDGGDFSSQGNSPGGGGDGYYGGGAAALHAGGGGGSAYTHPTLVTDAKLVSGAQNGNAGGAGEPDYSAGIGVGKGATAGGNGRVVIRYKKLVCPGGAASCTLCNSSCEEVPVP